MKLFKNIRCRQRPLYRTQRFFPHLFQFLRSCQFSPVMYNYNYVCWGSNVFDWHQPNEAVLQTGYPSYRYFTFIINIHDYIYLVFLACSCRRFHDVPTRYQGGTCWFIDFSPHPLPVRMQCLFLRWKDTKVYIRLICVEWNDRNVKLMSRG